MTMEQESSLDSSRFSTRSQEWPQQKNNKKSQRNKAARMLLFSKRILIFIMIGFTIHSNFSLIGKEGNFNEARGKKRQRSERDNSLKRDDGPLGENKTKVTINAIQKMYNGGHLNRDFAKYILLQGKDMMAQLPSFYNVPLPMIDDYEERTLSKKRITVRFYSLLLLPGDITNIFLFTYL